jgi:hypothetical protein
VALVSIYPLPMRFPVPFDGTSANAKAKRPLQGGDYIDVSISPEGWMFMAQTDRLTFEGQAVGDRLEYRRAFEAQVALAKDTPTRGAA